MLLRLIHCTHYRYPGFAYDSQNEVRLMPLTDETQICREFRLRTTPWANVHSYEEPGGTVHHFGIRSAHRELEIVAEATVETLMANPYEGLDLSGTNWAFYNLPTTLANFAEYVSPSPYVPKHPAATKLAEEARAASDGSVIGFLIDLNHLIHERLEYDPDVTHVHTTLDDIIQLQAGVCQDFAHLMISCARSQGIPCRYVSGYLFVGDIQGMRGEQATHAWLECALPDGRWLALDPTNDLLANDRYIRVHTGRDYSEVSPTRGIYIGQAASALDVVVAVERAESPLQALRSPA